MCAQETQKTEENERGVDLNINIYYGGRGIIDDPTIYVINKMQEVLEELRVHVERYNLYDGKTNITALPQTLKEADGIILATIIPSRFLVSRCTLDTAMSALLSLTGLSPSLVCFPKTVLLELLNQLCGPNPGMHALRFGLFPFRSPLLWKSIFLSLPPAT